MVDRRFLAAALFVILPACIAPSVLQSSGRAVTTDEAESPSWRPAEARDLEGLYESETIEGDGAAAVSRVWYHFAPDGSWSGAALIVGGVQPAFQTLSGTWSLESGALDLGDGEPVQATVAGERLRLASQGGVAVLKRAPIR